MENSFFGGKQRPESASECLSMSCLNCIYFDLDSCVCNQPDVFLDQLLYEK